MTSLPQPSYRHILDVYFRQAEGSGILAHQIESFNQFMDIDIPEIIHMSNPIKVGGSPEIPLQGPRSALATATGLSSTAAKALIRQEEKTSKEDDDEGGENADGETACQDNSAIGNSAASAGANSGNTCPPLNPVKHEYEITIELEKISFRKPTIFENNGAIYPVCLS